VREIGPVASTMSIDEMHALGLISGKQTAALTGLASIAHDSGALRDSFAIEGDKRMLRYIMV